MFRRAPASTAAAILTIALGIAANTAVFSAVNAAMLRPLPYPDASRLMQVAERNEKLNLPYFSASALNYLSWKELSRTFEQLGAFGDAAYTIAPESLSSAPTMNSTSGSKGTCDDSSGASWRRCWRSISASSPWRCLLTISAPRLPTIAL